MRAPRRRARGRAATKIKSPAAEFKRALPAATHRALRLIGRIAGEAGYRAYLVGGIVRDIALGHPNTDLDVVIEGRADVVARRFARETGGTFKRPTGFATCKVDAGALGTMDFAEARTETYSRPGALPDVARADLERDLWRRDFTINAMALCLNPGRYGTLRDPCGGIDDLRGRRIRVMHPASFEDDPTRVLRGIRFAARYGFAFEGATDALARACVDGGGLETLSGKRIYREIALICNETSAASGLRMLARRGLLRRVLGPGWSEERCAALWRGLAAALGGRGAITEAAARPWVCWFASVFAGLTEDDARRVSERFNLPRDVREVCLWVATCLAPACGLARPVRPGDAFTLRMFLDSAPREGLVVLWAAGGPEARWVLTRYLTGWSKVGPRLGGGEIVALGCPRGPEVSGIRLAILRLKLDGKLATRDDEIAFAKRRIAALARSRRGNPC